MRRPSIQAQIDKINADQAENDQHPLNIMLSEIAEKIRDAGFESLTTEEFYFFNSMLNDIDSGIELIELNFEEEQSKPKDKTSDDWKKITPDNEFNFELCRTAFLTAFKKKSESVIQNLIEKLLNDDFGHLTSKEFDVAQKQFKQSNSSFDQLIIEEYNKIKETRSEDDEELPTPDKFLADLKKEFFDVSSHRLMLHSIVIEQRSLEEDILKQRSPEENILEQRDLEDEIEDKLFRRDLKLSRTEKFFDLLFHQYSPPETGPNAAKKPLRDHRALFIALVSEANSLNDSEANAFFREGRQVLEEKFHDLLSVPIKIDIPYANIYYAIFKDDSPGSVAKNIITQLKEYDPTNAGYDAAREKFLQTYYPTDADYDAAIEKFLQTYDPNAPSTSKHKNDTPPETKPAIDLDETSAPATPRNLDKNIIPLPAKPINPSTTITNSSTPGIHEINRELVFKSLWGGNNPTADADSACGKTLAAWNEKSSHSPAMFPPPEFTFKKPELDNIKIDETHIEINLCAIHQSKKEIDITLSRKVNSDKSEETWVCESSDDLISEIKQFELIAAESLALRKAQGVKEAEKIGIMDIGEAVSDKKHSTKFKLNLSDREEALIEAHFRVGYTEITYGKYVLKETSDFNLTPK